MNVPIVETEGPCGALCLCYERSRSTGAQCESRDSNPDGFPHWILSPFAAQHRIGRTASEWHRVARNATTSAREYDRYYDFFIDSASRETGKSRACMKGGAFLRRRVVVKVLPPEMAEGLSVERFKREVPLAARLQHPHIVPVL